ncbi:MAG: hypothetical protein GY743_23510 [Planctomycetaceae bacterium]|nr:hypothetical protein [Planctomycetaceae bacterium]
MSEIDIQSLPNHKIKNRNEWSSACPQCGGKDRFIYTVDKQAYWCRQCEFGGYVGQQSSSISPEERAEIERRNWAREQADRDRQRTALERLQAKRNDLTYHRQLNGNGDYVTNRWGITADTIDIFRVGYCNACPTSPESDSITIPYYWGEKLINLRHRLSSPNGEGKYRPESKGLPTAIFNANIIAGEEWVVLVEGEFKAMVLNQNHLPAFAIPGATIFKEKWLRLFRPDQMVYVALDPGVEQAAIRIVKMFSAANLQARLVSIPTKPDDFFTRFGGTVGQFCTYLEAGRIC